MNSMRPLAALLVSISLVFSTRLYPDITVTTVMGGEGVSAECVNRLLQTNVAGALTNSAIAGYLVGKQAADVASTVSDFRSALEMKPVNTEWPIPSAQELMIGGAVGLMFGLAALEVEFEKYTIYRMSLSPGRTVDILLRRAWFDTAEVSPTSNLGRFHAAAQASGAEVDYWQMDPRGPFKRLCMYAGCTLAVAAPIGGLVGGFGFFPDYDIPILAGGLVLSFGGIYTAIVNYFWSQRDADRSIELVLQRIKAGTLVDSVVLIHTPFRKDLFAQAISEYGSVVEIPSDKYLAELLARGPAGQEIGVDGMQQLVDKSRVYTDWVLKHTSAASGALWNNVRATAQAILNQKLKE